MTVETATPDDDRGELPADPPGRGAFGPAVERFDDTVDRALERLRGHPVPDRIFQAASYAGEFSAVWHTLSITRGIIRHEPRRVVAFAVAIGLESLIVNQGLKRLFKRSRPTVAGDERVHVRQPLTSSFPSGHSSASAFASTVMAGRDGQPWATAWYGIGATVAVSRAYVRIHHASDVVGGLVVGRLMGLVARRVLRRVV